MPDNGISNKQLLNLNQNRPFALTHTGLRPRSLGALHPATLTCLQSLSLPFACPGLLNTKGESMGLASLGCQGVAGAEGSSQQHMMCAHARCQCPASRGSEISPALAITQAIYSYRPPIYSYKALLHVK